MSRRNVRDIGSIRFGKYSIDVVEEQDLTNALGVVITMYAFVGDEDEESANEVFFPSSFATGRCIG